MISMNRWREVGSNSLRYCERSDEPGVPFSVIAARSGTDEAIRSSRDIHGLLRFARNDGIQQPIKTIRKKSAMSTHAPKQIDPSASLHAEALGQAKSHGRRTGRRIVVVGAGQRKIVDEDPPIGNGRAMSVLFGRGGGAVAC